MTNAKTTIPTDPSRLRSFRQLVQTSELFDTSHWQSVMAVVLTCRPAVQADGGREWLDGRRARGALAAFMTALNAAAYKKAYKRFGKRLRVIPVLEKGHLPSSLEKETKWHWNLAIEPPSHIEPAAFQQLLKECWKEIEWSHHCWAARLPTQEDSRKWLNYILKNRQKSFAEAWVDCVDWERLHNPK